VDVGRGQLDWKLRNDERVVCMEQTNFRYVLPKDIMDELDFASVDVSFISLTKILIPARNLLKAGGQMVCLIKPQFEAGREKVGKNGVVREPKVHREVIEKIVDFADSIGFAVRGLDYSPIKGPEGNIEYLLLLCKEKEPPEEIRELGEKEAQMRLEQIQASKTGLSQREEWQKIIQETVKNSHQL
ncbi:MAG TPA: TlyA family RNA methyltransferase, partial [Candidatus Acetatifactor stercoripullorum]|nr:TlyA family RNA methyltransferase [Candidatus Acetatifactor stercoripullorum]